MRFIRTSYVSFSLIIGFYFLYISISLSLSPFRCFPRIFHMLIFKDKMNMDLLVAVHWSAEYKRVRPHCSYWQSKLILYCCTQITQQCYNDSKMDGKETNRENERSQRISWMFIAVRLNKMFPLYYKLLVWDAMVVALSYTYTYTRKREYTQCRTMILTQKHPRSCIHSFFDQN